MPDEIAVAGTRFGKATDSAQPRNQRQHRRVRRGIEIAVVALKLPADRLPISVSASCAEALQPVTALSELERAFKARFGSAQSGFGDDR